MIFSHKVKTMSLRKSAHNMKWGTTMFSAPRETSVMFLKEIYYFNLSDRSLKCIKYSSSLIALDSLPY